MSSVGPAIVVLERREHQVGQNLGQLRERVGLGLGLVYEQRSTPRALVTELPEPDLVVVCGPPLFGKSTVCEELARQRSEIHHFAAGRRLRQYVELADEQDEQTATIKAIMAEGRVEDVDTVAARFLLSSWFRDVVSVMSKEDEETMYSWLLDGFPRSGLHSCAMWWRSLASSRRWS